MRVSELNSPAKCSFRRSRKIDLVSSKKASEPYRIALIVRGVIKSYFEGMPLTQLRETMTDAFLGDASDAEKNIGIGFITEGAGAIVGTNNLKNEIDAIPDDEREMKKGDLYKACIQLRDNFKCVERYLKSELVDMNGRVPLFPPLKTVKVFDMDVEGGGYAVFINDYMIEVVKYRNTMAKYETLAPEEDMELYWMLQMGLGYLAPGEKKVVAASYYYLKKDNDSYAKDKGNFDPDFFETTGGHNIKTLSTQMPVENTGSGADNPYEDLFRQRFEKFKEGIDREECSEDDCKQCPFDLACHYTHAPIADKTEKVIRSISDLVLSKEQEDVTNHDSGILRVNAAAGSGKTLVLVLRIITLLLKGVKPEEILVLTFTNTGAQEMKARTAIYNEDIGTGEDISEMIMTTFNSFGDMIVKNEYMRFGFTEPPSVIEDDMRSAIIATLLKDNIIEGLNYRGFKNDMKYSKGALAVAKQVFSLIKQNNYSIQDAPEIYKAVTARFATEDAIKELISLYDQYDAMLKAKNLIEFADQELMVHQILSDDPYYLDHFGFKHIIVDEFQDSSLDEINLLRRLTDCPSFESLMVVGDDSQSIFGFRGTSPDFLINFAQYIGKPVEDIYLVENYRSQAKIIEFANKINDRIQSRVIKDMKPTVPAGKPVVVEGFIDKDTENARVIDIIKKKLAEGRAYNDIAYIAQDRYSLYEISDLLGAEGIPSVLMNPEPLMENSRVRAALEFVKYLQDPGATQSILVALNAELGGDLFVLPDEDIEKNIEARADEAARIMKLPEKKKVERINEILSYFDEDDGDEVYESFTEKIAKFSTAAQIFEYCENFEEYGASNAFRRVNSYPGVILTTAHSSKGLEWPVIINSLTKYDKPELHNLASNKAYKLDEIRRLLFVSATRAKEELYVTGVYAVRSKADDRKYNQFLVDCYEIAGKEFSIATIKALEEEKKAKKAEAKAKRLAELGALRVSPEVPDVGEASA